MRITELTAFVVRIPLKKRIKHASHSRTDTDNVLVRARLDDGSVGWGEGVPREYVTGESAESALQLLQSSDIKTQLTDCGNFMEALRMIEAIRLAAVPGDARGVQGNAARCALEIACLDAFGRTFGEPLCNVTKYLAPDLYQFRDKVQYSGAITSARRGVKIRLASWRMRIFGVKHLKVKVGMEGHDDPYRLKMIRRRVGKSVDIRVDANEAWPADVAAEKIAALEPFGISAVEQPVPHAEVDRLTDIRKRVKTPIMLDESLCGMTDAEHVTANGLCDLFNLRLSKCGGFIPSLRLAQFAVKHELGYQLGCQIGETAILSAAGRHFATSVKNLRAIEGSYDRHLVQYPLGDEDITFGWGGWAPALVRTGLGIGVQEDFVERLATRKELLLG
ncbi:MAG TPA: enolase C-terminal domain-like protein [Gemmataceae bacterium]|jgi:muconate cycloisomerase|nr:enolase C-terminal domain-like protein [Gemmataceae bacterium]